MDFSIPRRQHPLGVIILAAQFLWRTAQQAWPLLVGLSLSDGSVWKWAWAGGGLLLLTGAFAWAYYLRFRYRIEQDALVVDKGVFQKERLQIPFERIQSIQLFQGPLQQLLGLTGLRVDTAGSSGSELQLVAVRMEVAEGLRQALRKGKRSMAAHPEVDVIEPEQQAEEAKVLVTLGLRDLLKVGLSQNHLRNAFAGLALVLYIMGNVEEAVGDALAALPPFVMALMGLAFFALLVPGTLLFLIAGVAISMVTAVSRYYRLHSTIGAEGLNVQMGLLRRNAFQVPFARIHLTEWRSNWIRRKLGFETLEVRQAQARAIAEGGMRVFLPAMESRHRANFEAEVYPDLDAPPWLVLKPVRRWRWLLWVMSSIPLVPLCWAAPGWGTVFAVACWLSFTWWTTARHFEALRMQVYRDTVVMERGWFWKRRSLLKLSQLQGIEWRRNVLLERRRVGHLVFHTAAGSRKFSYLGADEGRQLVDLALNQHHVGATRA